MTGQKFIYAFFINKALERLRCIGLHPDGNIEIVFTLAIGLVRGFFDGEAKIRMGGYVPIGAAEQLIRCFLIAQHFLRFISERKLRVIHGIDNKLAGFIGIARYEIYAARVCDKFKLPFNLEFVVFERFEIGKGWAVMGESLRPQYGDTAAARVNFGGG